MEEQLRIGEYIITKKIGEGSFGQIHEATKDGTIYAIKTEIIATIKPMIALEYDIYKQIGNNHQHSSRGYGFPEAYGYFQKQHFSYMVMDKLDLTLFDLVKECLQNKVKKDILLVIMFNTLKCYVYRDVKPSNFMLKKSQLDRAKGKIYLIDLGLCKQYLKKKSDKHIILKQNKKMIGTPLFCSLNTHKGLQISRRDDLESWLYMSIYFVKILPWEHILTNNSTSATENLKQNKEILYQTIGKIKQQTNIPLLIKAQQHLPFCLLKIYQYITNLQFQSRPNYEYIYQLLQSCNCVNRQNMKKLQDLRSVWMKPMFKQEVQSKKDKDPLKISRSTSKYLVRNSIKQKQKQLQNKNKLQKAKTYLLIEMIISSYLRNYIFISNLSNIKFSQMDHSQTKLTDFWKHKMPIHQNSTSVQCDKEMQQAFEMPNLNQVSSEKVKENLMLKKHRKIITKERDYYLLQNRKQRDRQTNKKIEDYLENGLFMKRVRELIISNENKNVIESSQMAKDSTKIFHRDTSNDIPPNLLQVAVGMKNERQQTKQLLSQPLNTLQQTSVIGKQEIEQNISYLKNNYIIEGAILKDESALESNIRYYNGFQFQFQNIVGQSKQTVWINSTQIFKLNPSWLAEFYAQFI